jgi:hypothetical protein
MKTIYLHVGMHKTATTAIQVCLRKNEGALAGLGYAIPRSGVSGTTHNNIAFSIRNLPRFDPENGGIDELVNELSGSSYDRFIVSAEALDHLSAEEIELLRLKLLEFDVRVIVWLRRQVEWLQSEWSEMVKLRFYQDDFATWIQQRTAGDRRLHYFEFLEAWSRVFGSDNVRVRVYEKDRYQERDVFPDFLAACDVEDDHSWELATTVNVSPSIKTLEVIRTYVRHYREVLPEKKLLGRCKQIVEFANQQGWNDEPLNLVDQTLFLSIHEMFSQTNDRVAEVYLQRDSLFGDTFEDRQITEFDIAEMDVVELFQLFAFLEH